MKKFDILTNLSFAKQAAIKAGELLLSFYQKNYDVFDKKNEKGIVTVADKQSEKVILKILTEHTPYSVLSEENGLIRKKGNLTWVVDPLDGTTNFFQQIPYFCISIALMHKDELLLSYLYHPVNGTHYHAIKGEGAYCNGLPIRVSQKNIDRKLLICITDGYGIEKRKKYISVIESFNGKHNIRKLGASALDLCLVASGVSDAFISPGDELWDYAAGILLVQEAGGKVTDWHGSKWDVDTKYLLASNRAVHKTMVEQLTHIQP